MFFLYYEYFDLCFFINSLFQRPSKGVLMSLCRSFSNPPVAYLARDKCRCSIFATNNCRCRFFARIQMFAKRECCAIFFLCFPILNSTKSARKTVQTRERHSILWHQRITNDTKDRGTQASQARDYVFVDLCTAKGSKTLTVWQVLNNERKWNLSKKTKSCERL